MEKRWKKKCFTDNEWIASFKTRNRFNRALWFTRFKCKFSLNIAAINKWITSLLRIRGFDIELILPFWRLVCLPFCTHLNGSFYHVMKWIVEYQIKNWTDWIAWLYIQFHLQQWMLLGPCGSVILCSRTFNVCKWIEFHPHLIIYGKSQKL